MKTINALQPRDTTRLLRVARVLTALASDIEMMLGAEAAQPKPRRGRPPKSKSAKTRAKRKSKTYPVDAPPAAETES